jgi:hypothetical protein
MNFVAENLFKNSDKPNAENRFRAIINEKI